MSGDMIQPEETDHLFFAEVRKIVGCAFCENTVFNEW